MENKYSYLEGNTISLEEAEKILPDATFGRSYQEEYCGGDRWLIVILGVVVFTVKSLHSPTTKVSLRHNDKFNVKIKSTGEEIIVCKMGRHDANIGREIAPVYISTKDYRTQYEMKELIFQ